jgi:hypothetical protein
MKIRAQIPFRWPGNGNIVTFLDYWFEAEAIPTEVDIPGAGKYKLRDDAFESKDKEGKPYFEIGGKAILFTDWRDCDKEIKRIEALGYQMW